MMLQGIMILLWMYSQLYEFTEFLFFLSFFLPLFTETPFGNAWLAKYQCPMQIAVSWMGVWQTYGPRVIS